MPTLPAAVADVPTLSYSSSRTYLECPLRWRFLYVDRLEEAPRGYFSFGRTIHSVLEEFVRPLVRPLPRLVPGGGRQRTLDQFLPPAEAAPPPAPMSRTDLLALYQQQWIAEGYTSAQEESRYQELGKELLGRYYDAFVAHPPHPVSVEEHLTASWDGIPVHGYIDRIDQTEGGGLEVLDYKTGRGLSVQDAHGSEQLTFYQMLVERNYPAPVESLALVDLRGSVELRVRARRPADLDALQARVGEVYDGIRSEEFEPLPGRHCQRCEFRLRCPEFREVPDADRERLGALVDEYIGQRTDGTGAGRSPEALAEELHREAERLELRRLPGGQGTILRRREVTSTMPPERWVPIAPLLPGPVGSGDAPPTPEQLARWLRDPTLTSATRRALRSAATRSVRWYWEFERPPARLRPRNG